MKYHDRLARIRTLLAGPAADRAVSQALALLEEDPSNGEPLRAVADYYARTNQHEVVLMLADAYETRFKQTLGYDPYAADFMKAVSGYYSNVPGVKDNSALITDNLSLSAGIDQSRRVAARNNLEWYASDLTTTIDSPIEFKQITLGLDDGYQELNPSICMWRGIPWMIQRTVNYILNDDGNYVPVVDDNIRTRNWLCRLDDVTFDVVAASEILNPVDWPQSIWPYVFGFEDCRLFVNNDQLWTSSTVRELTSDGRAQIVLACIEITNDGTCRFTDWHAIEPSHTTAKYEKNWMPIVDSLDIRWIYSFDTSRVVNRAGNTTSVGASIMATDHWRGSSQALPYNNGYIVVIHETIVSDYKNRKYLHRFVWLDANWIVQGISPTFYIKDCGIEFVAGLAIAKCSNSGVDKFVMSFGYKDSQSWLAFINADAVIKSLKPVRAPNYSYNTGVTDLANIKTVLMDSSDVVAARDWLVASGLPLHVDIPKNWDNNIALNACLTSKMSQYSPILDVGATADSAILSSLQRCGYFNVYSINPDQHQDFEQDGVCFVKGDITCTRFPNNMFGFISCLSVIEHGVDVMAFFTECHRIMKSGARLVVSTDYWSYPVDTQGIVLWGQPFKIFTPADITNMIDIAAKCGFYLLVPFDPATSDPIILNMGLRYTFACLIFEKMLEI